MKKLLHRLSIVLLLVLVSGYSNVHARTVRHFSPCHSSLSQHLPIATPFIRSSHSQSENQSPDFLLPLPENEEDNDLSSFKKQLESGNLPTSILFSQLAWPFFTSPGKVQSFCYNLSNTSSWYLVLQVFRL